MSRTERHPQGTALYPSQTELAGGLASASEKPRRHVEAPAVGPITARSLRGAAGDLPRLNVQGFETATYSRALRPDLVRALAATVVAISTYAMEGAR